MASAGDAPAPATSVEPASATPSAASPSVNPPQHEPEREMTTIT
jgi:hypothetical protein